MGLSENNMILINIYITIISISYMVTRITPMGAEGISVPFLLQLICTYTHKPNRDASLEASNGMK